MSKTKASLLCALCIALSTALNGLFAAVGLYCHFYIAALICVLLCPFEYALLCAVASPLLSALIAGTPTAAMLPALLAQSIVFTLVCAAFEKFTHGKMKFAGSCVRITVSVVAGCAAGILANCLLYLPEGSAAALWSGAALLRTIPDLLVLVAVALPAENILRENGII